VPSRFENDRPPPTDPWRPVGVSQTGSPCFYYKEDRRVKRVLYLHTTPLAALLALERVGSLPPQGWTAYIDSLPAEAHRAGFLAAGQDKGGHDVFALWYRARLKVLQRFVESLLGLLLDQPDVTVTVVEYPHPGAAVGLLLYRVGLRFAGRLCLWLTLRRCRRAAERPPELTPASCGCIIGAECSYGTDEKADKKGRSARR